MIQPRNFQKAHPSTRVFDRLKKTVKLLIGALAALSFIALNVMEFGTATPLVSSLQNFLHVPAYMLFTFLFFVWFKRSKSPLIKSKMGRNPIVCSVLASFFLGAAMELLQYPTNRDASFEDLAYNLAGSMGAAFFLLSARSPNIWIRRAAPALPLIIIGLFLIPAMRIALLDWRSQQLMPTLADFEQPWQLAIPLTQEARTQIVTTPQEWKENSSAHALEITLEREPYPGIRLERYGWDWSGYTCFEFEIFSPQAETLGVWVRIDDAAHVENASDRFNRYVPIAPGHTSFTVSLDTVKTAPAGRAMNLADMRRVFVFSGPAKLPYTLYIDNIRLSGKSN